MGHGRGPAAELTTSTAWRPRLVARNAVLKAGVHATRGLSLVLVVLAARALGPQDFGRFTFAFSLAVLLGAALDLGMHGVLVRDMARAPGDAGRQWRAGATLKLAALVPAGGALVTGAWLTGQTLSTQAAVWLLGLAVALQAFTELSVCVFTARERFELDLALRLSEKALLLLLGLVTLGLGGGLVAVSAVFALAAAASAVGGGVLVHRMLVPIAGALEPAGARALARTLGPIGLAYVCDFAKTRLVAPIVLLAAGDVAAGYFGAAARVLEIAMVAPVAVVAGVLPTLSRAAGDRSALRAPLVQVTDVLVVLGLAVALVLPAAGGALVQVVYGSRFAPAGPVVGVLGVAATLAFVNYFLSFVLLALDRPARLVTVSALGLAASLVLTPLLAGARGAEGGAIAILALEAFTLAVSLTAVAPLTGLPFGRDTAKAGAAALVALALSHLAPVTDITRAAATLTLYAATLALLRPRCLTSLLRR